MILLKRRVGAGRTTAVHSIPVRKNTTTGSQVDWQADNLVTSTDPLSSKNHRLNMTSIWPSEESGWTSLISFFTLSSTNRRLSRQYSVWRLWAQGTTPWITPFSCILTGVSWRSAKVTATWRRKYSLFYLYVATDTGGYVSKWTQYQNSAATWIPSGLTANKTLVIYWNLLICWLPDKNK